MPIDYKAVTLEDLDADGLEELKAMVDTLTGEKAALKAKASELLSEKKKLAAQLKPWESLQSELEVESAEEAAELVIKARGATSDPDDKNPLADQIRELKEAREREKAEQKRVLAEREATFNAEKASWEKALADKQGELRQTVVQTKLQQALAGKFVDPEDGINLLRRKGYNVDLVDDDEAPLLARDVVAYRGTSTTVPIDLDTILGELEKDPSCQHYLKSTFVSGGGGFNPGNKVAGDNPWAKDTFNRTRQLIMLSEDPAKAARLKEAAK